MHCPACQVEVVPEALFCHRCGERLASAGAATMSPASAQRPSATSGAERIDEPVATFTTPQKPESEEPERELWRGRYCSKEMIGGWILSIAVTVVLLAVGIWWRPELKWWLALAAAALLVWLYHLALLGYRLISVRYLLTTQRFIHEMGLLRRVTNRIEVLDMDDISFEQTLLERLVGVGTIHIVSSDRSDPQYTLVGIDDVRKVAEMFDDARRTERRRRGLHIEQI